MTVESSATVAQVAAAHALILAGVPYYAAALAVGSTRRRLRRFMVPNWIKQGRPILEVDVMRADYEGGVHTRAIAEKFGVSEFAVKAYAQRNGWRRLVRAKQIRRQAPPPRVPVPRVVKEPDWSAFWRQDQPGPLKRRPPAFVPDYASNRMVANQ